MSGKDIGMASAGLLFVNNAAKGHNYCAKASKFVKNVFYIKIKGNKNNALPYLSKQIENVYTKATKHCPNLDVRLILKQDDINNKTKTHYPVEIILYDSELAPEIKVLKESVAFVDDKCRLQNIDFSETVEEFDNLDPVKQYEYVVLGGTFDRLHNGHKILLSQAVLRATKHLTVGVTDVNMIQTKRLWELIEPIKDRIKGVLNFLKDINPHLEYDVVPIQDLYGPTKDDPRFQCLVVSEETSRGIEKINEKRKENHISQLDSHVIGLAKEDEKQISTEEEEDKVSSSNKRIRMLGTLLKPVVPNNNIPAHPYVIGIAGGIASGKTAITKSLSKKGAAVINCDLIAHELYKPGLPLTRTLAETFGNHIITKSGDVDRVALGQIVFNDKQQLDKLNNIVWPAIMEEALNRIKNLGHSHDVVVMEAAVMARAKWHKYCHEVWAVIVPPHEAIKRIQERNSLTEEQARKRVESQPSNAEQVEIANVVLSPYWSYEHTQKQIDKAWNNVKRHQRFITGSRL